MHSAKLKTALGISAVLLGILVSFFIPVYRTVALWGVFATGEVFFCGGIILAAVGAGRSTSFRKILGVAASGIEGLSELARQSARSNLVLAGLLFNWVGAVIYPMLLVVLVIVSMGHTVGALIGAILVVDIFVTFAWRIPLLRFIHQERSTTIPLPPERGASV